MTIDEKKLKKEKKTKLQSQPEADLDIKEKGKLVYGWAGENGDEDNVSIREIHLK